MKTAKTNVKDHEQARAEITFNGKPAIMSLDWEKPSRFYIHVRGKGINKVITEEYDPRAILLEWVKAMKKYGGELVARTPKQKELLQKQRQLAADWKNMKSAYFAPGFLRAVRMAYLQDIREGDLKMSPKDKKVLDAFTSEKPGDSKKFHSDGKVLDGLWMGGNKIAWWQGGKLHIRNPTGRADQTVMRALKKMTPKNLLAGSVVEVEASNLAPMHKKLLVSWMMFSDAAKKGGYDRQTEVLAAAVDKALSKFWNHVKTKTAAVAAGGKTPYQEYFDKKLKDWDIKSPDELDEAKKKIFFEQVDKGWKGKDEKPEPGESEGKMISPDEVSGKKRDYAKEYRDYHSKPEQKKNRAKRNSARRKLGLDKGDSREVDHKNPLSKGGGNSDKNLRAVSRKTNRQKGDRQAVTDVAAAGQAVGKAQKAIMHYLLRNQSGVTELTEMVRYPTFRGMHFGAVEKAAEALAKKGLVVYKGGKVALNPKSASMRQAALPPPAEQLKMMTANPPRLKGTQIEIFSPTVKKYIGMAEWPDAASAKKDLAMWMAAHKETLTKLKALTSGCGDRAAVEAGDGWKEVKLPGKPYPYRWRTNDLYKKNPRTQAALDIQYKNPKVGWRDVTNLSIRDAVQKAAKKQGLKTGEVQGASKLKKQPGGAGLTRWEVVKDGQTIGMIKRKKDNDDTFNPYEAFVSKGGSFEKIGLFYSQSEFSKWKAKGGKNFRPSPHGQRGGQAAAVKAIEKAVGKTAAVEGRKDPQIAKTILQQLGGSGRLKAMLGAKHFIDHGDGLSFQFPNPKRNKGNYFKVTLDEGSDTYNLEIGKIAGTSYKKLKEVTGVYAGAMKKFFEGFTGLRMSL